MIIVRLVQFAILITILSGCAKREQQFAHGFTFTRTAPDTIRVAWGTPSGVDLSPEFALEFLWGQELKRANEGDVSQFEFPPVSKIDGVWMFDLDHSSSSSLECLVNPLNSNAMRQAIQILNLRKEETFDSERVTRIVAGNLVYLGWVIQDELDVQLLKTKLKNRSDEMRLNDVAGNTKTLYRLELGVEKHFAKDPTNKTELAIIRSKIPVLFERLDSTKGHPCEFMHVLYLDGHTERIKFGTKFPATKEFTSLF